MVDMLYGRVSGRPVPKNADEWDLGTVSVVPTGTTIWFNASTPPSGFLEEDGSEVSMTTYEDLYDVIGNLYGLDSGTTCTFDYTTDIVTSAGHGLSDDDVIELSTDNALPAELAEDTKYFVVNKTTDTFQLSLTRGGSAIDFSDNGTGNHKFHKNFKVPDSRGEFVRGWDHGRGVDSGRALGSSQTDEFESHRHYLLSAGGGALKQVICGCSGNGGEISTAGTGGQAYTTYVGSTETRPRNVSKMPCIKY